MVKENTYLNYRTMKKNRIVKLKQVKCKCEICEGRAQVVHHIDEGMDNHSMDNLLAVCANCHKALHHPDKIEEINRRHTSKYTRLYGQTFKQMQEFTDTPMATLRLMHKSGNLQSFLDSCKK